METALSRGKARELIRLYESRLLTDPDFLPYKMNLAVMYALSCRLDHDLGPEDITTRRSKAIQLAREAFDAELAETQPNLEALLHSGSTLAQVYAVLGSTNKMKGVFGELTKALAENKEALERITHGMDLLENRLEHGYPLDATNPFKDP